MNEICFGHAQRRRLRRVLNVGICNLFEICLPAVFLAGCLLFEISPVSASEAFRRFSLGRSAAN